MKGATAGIVLTLFGYVASSQPTATKLEFEVASVKPAPPPDGRGIRVGMRGGPGTSDPTRLVIENLSVFALVTRACDLKTFQVTGADAMDPLRFNITAKVPEGATKEDLRVMLQNLLAERFKLKYHHETKEMPIYELVVGKNGPKFKESTEGSPKEDSTPMKLDRDGYPMPPRGQMGIMSVNGNLRARLNAANESMSEFVKELSYEVDRLVFDGTGLKGKYDFVLSWSPEPMGAVPPPSPVGAATSTPEDSGPTLAVAIQQQLGLRLESKKGPVDILVIEHYEKLPTEN